MKAGPLDRLIDIERSTLGQDPSGQPIEVWTKIVVNRPAGYSPITGWERYTGEQFAASEQVEFLIRWMDGINPKDRVVYPAGIGGGSPPLENIYEIMATLESGRRDGLRLMTVRRAERTEV